ncbi:hypothetical protein TCAL_08871 [Tigriopus californicus]|uniref:Uncharacterized protein n=1 Tax=Tigriopus californicus TaxID=6832 RepID=A0A553N8X4_TIGCA|nr:hypothetical protein TCAL_08871 [Tigriopus californicus]
MLAFPSVGVSPSQSQNLEIHPTISIPDQGMDGCIGCQMRKHDGGTNETPDSDQRKGSDDAAALDALIHIPVDTTGAVRDHGPLLALRCESSRCGGRQSLSYVVVGTTTAITTITPTTATATASDLALVLQGRFPRFV